MGMHGFGDLEPMHWVGILHFYRSIESCAIRVHRAPANHLQRYEGCCGTPATIIQAPDAALLSLVHADIPSASWLPFIASICLSAQTNRIVQEARNE